ncbi:hypothetical protein, partial [Erwinia amylovora]|uniref:hypothetical protein n=1 Tax=Erwinia amylovora TaxID=552 RepID=UPI0020BE8F1F
VQVYEGDGFDVIIKIRLPDIGPEGVKPKEALAALLTLFTAYDANTARTFIQFLLTQIWMSARRLSVPPVIPLDSVTAPLTP